jgi:hypothetical protein
LTWSGTNQTVTVTNHNGLLAIQSSRAVYVRAFWAAEERPTTSSANEITPEPVQLLSFAVSPTNSLAYEIHHFEQDPTLFRIEVRRAPPGPPVASGTKADLPFPGAATHPTTITQEFIKYVLLDDTGTTFQSGEVPLTNLLSAYDWLVTTNGPTPITEPQALCFVLPPEVAGLRVSSPRETVLVNAYTRPYRLVKVMRIPEDYSPQGTFNPEQPSWFTVRPPDFVARREVGQTGLIQVQPRLSEQDPLVLAGHYEWDSFLPNSQPRGHQILLPVTGPGPTRPESLSFTYYPVKTGCLERVRLLSDPWEPQVAPTLVLASSSTATAAANVSIDGRMIFQHSLVSPVTELRLGSLKPGEHSISINSAAPLSAFLNYVESSSSTAYLQRFCVQASSNVLAFPYTKRQAGAEVLVMKIFTPASPQRQEAFRVRLQLRTDRARDTGPFDDLTVPEREARVTPNPVSRTWAIGATPARLDDGQPVFFPIGSDFPPGQYMIEVAVETDKPCWLSLSRTTPGVADKLVLSLQPRTF